MAEVICGVVSKAKGKEDVDRASDSEDDSDDDDEIIDLTNLSENEIASGSYLSYLPSRGRNVTQRLQLFTKDGAVLKEQTRFVRGRFDPVFTNCAWKIHLNVNDSKKGKVLLAKSPPSYSIRDDGAVGISDVGIFLTSLETDCGIPMQSDDNCISGWSQHVNIFLEFTSKSGLKCTFNDLIPNLVMFRDSSTVNGEIFEQIWTRLKKSVPGKAFLVPFFTKHVHRLFPNQASQLLNSLSLEQLQELQRVLQREPWIFGYKHLLKTRHKIPSCEAKLKSFRDCGLLETMDPVMKDALYIYNAVTKDCYQQGHTYIPLKNLTSPKYFNKLFSPGEHTVTKWNKAIKYLCEQHILGKECLQGTGSIIFLPCLKEHEETIAENVSCHVMSSDPWIKTKNFDSRVFGGDKDQIEAAELITSSPVVVLSGKGGCGKTYVVSQIISNAKKQSRAPKCDEEPGPEGSLLMECDSPPPPDNSCDGNKNNYKPELSVGEILLTAPTGKAASILGKRTKIKAYTLHYVIYSFFAFLRGLKNIPEDKIEEQSWKFSDVRVLVCDECSLICVKIFSTILGLLKREAKLQQIILLGDCNQLPSIEPGNFFVDIYEALEQYGLSLTLRTNHRSESHLIVKNAERISQQKNPIFDTSEGFVDYPVSSNGTNSSINETVNRLLKKEKLDARNSQFLAFRRNDVDIINELCAIHYNNHPTKDHRGKLWFMKGDKICIGKNWTCFDSSTLKGLRLCNGEIFFIADDVTCEEHGKKKRVLTLDDGEQQIKVDYLELKKAKIKHAWARTIHTYQGSETDTVVYVVGSPFNQHWQHVYTAVTRGRSKVFIIANQDFHLKMAILSKPLKRNTRLKEFLKKKISEPVMQKKKVEIFSHQESIATSHTDTEPMSSESLEVQDTGIDNTDLTADSAVEIQPSTAATNPENNLILPEELQDELSSSENECLINATQEVEDQLLRKADKRDETELCKKNDDVSSCRAVDNPFDVVDGDGALLNYISETEKVFLHESGQTIGAQTGDRRKRQTEDGSHDNHDFVITRKNLRRSGREKQPSCFKGPQPMVCTNEQDSVSSGRTHRKYYLSPDNSSLVLPTPPLTPERNSSQCAIPPLDSPCLLRMGSRGSSQPAPTKSVGSPRTPNSPPECGIEKPYGSKIQSMQTPSPFRQSYKRISREQGSSRRSKGFRIAQYDGTCKICRCSIRQGVDRICLQQRGTKHWTHVKCADC